MINRVFIHGLESTSQGAKGQYFHKRYKGCGYLWQGRFQSRPVQKENYLITCGMYIDFNPVKDKIVSVASDYAYSSARYYCLGRDDGITTKDPIYDELGSNAAQRQKEYVKSLREYINEADTEWEDMKTPLGDKDFIRRVVKQNGRIVSRRRGRPKRINF